MKVLRIKLRQNKASYTREETVTNKMTYPLPPYSTVIGAIHNACGYTEYHPMNISIQGKYGSMQKEIYVNHGLLNRREDDRNILVYLQNPDLLSTGYIKVGEGLKSQGNSFRKNITVRIDNQEYYDKYIALYNLKDELDIENKEIIKPKIAELKSEEKTIKDKLKKMDKKSDEYQKIKDLAETKKKEWQTIKSEYDERVKNSFTTPISHFKTLATGPKYQEVLYDVELLIHISTDEKTAKDILDNINNFNSVGRSEDFVELIEIKEVELFEPEDTVLLKDNYKIYANVNKVKVNAKEQKEFYFYDGDNKVGGKGTVYYLNKNYQIVDNKRVFNKIPCLYSSNLAIDEDSEGMYVDNDGYIIELN